MSLVFTTGDSSDAERIRWNEKYRKAAAEFGELKPPDPFLPHAFSKYIIPEFPRGGSALDLAGGTGRHAIWLARQGWEVTLIDISDVGVEQASRNAGSFASHIHFVVDDLTHFKAAQTCFDVVIGFFYLERPIFSEIVKVLRPGGIVIYKTYTVARAHSGIGPRNQAYLLKAGELRKLASGLNILHHREESLEEATAELVARKS